MGRAARSASEVEARAAVVAMERREKREKAIGDKAVQHLGKLRQWNAFV